VHGEALGRWVRILPSRRSSPPWPASPSRITTFFASAADRGTGRRSLPVRSPPLRRGWFAFESQLHGLGHLELTFAMPPSRGACQSGEPRPEDITSRITGLTISRCTLCSNLIVETAPNPVVHTARAMSQSAFPPQRTEPPPPDLGRSSRSSDCLRLPSSPTASCRDPQRPEVSNPGRLDAKENLTPSGGTATLERAPSARSRMDTTDGLVRGMSVRDTCAPS